ncbi:hypothetical protein LINPERPRIM_LOCUS24538 [Linum perenne]
MSRGCRHHQSGLLSTLMDPYSLRLDRQLQEACSVMLILNGHHLATFSMNLRIWSITRGELRGALTGLQIVWDRGFWCSWIRVSQSNFYWGWKGYLPILFSDRQLP